MDRCQAYCCAFFLLFLKNERKERKDQRFVKQDY
jgi:hypothetical protein